MPDLKFKIEAAAPEPFAATPQLNFNLQINNTDINEQIQSIMLRCQIIIEATQREYSVQEQQMLTDLFGEAKRWSTTLRSLLWTHTNIIITPFKGSIIAELPVSCSFDLTLASTKYFAGLIDGVLPLCFQFSGTIFYTDKNNNLLISQIPWHNEAKFRLPVDIWQKLMEIYYSNCAFLSLPKDILQQLHQYKIDQAIPTWEELFTRLLDKAQKDD